MLALLLVSQAYRSLSVEEALHALAVELKPGTTKFDCENMSCVDSIQSVCNGLIEVENGYIHLIHKSASDYFKRPQESAFKSKNGDVDFRFTFAQICLTYLSYEIWG
jgi:uncharacterized damage-inducible protein DinB